jgi:hypothetical protein
MSESACRISWLKLQFQALIVEDGASHSGVGEVTMLQILHDFDAGPTADLPRPVEISPTLRSQSCLSFAPTLAAVSFSRDLHLLFCTCLIQSIASIYLRVQNSGHQAITKSHCTPAS